MPGTGPGTVSNNDRLRVGWLNGFSSGRGTARAEDAQGTPTLGHVSLSILVYKETTWPSQGCASLVTPDAGSAHASVERTRDTRGSQGQIPALA